MIQAPKYDLQAYSCCLKVLRYLGDSTRMPPKDYAAFAQALEHTVSELQSWSPVSKSAFVIQHFAGKVTYQIADLSSKDRSIMPVELLHLAASSYSPIFRMLGSKQNTSTGKARPTTETASQRYLSVLRGFEKTLTDGPDQQVFWVRCIKPTHIIATSDSSTSLWLSGLVQQQLESGGVLSTIRTLGQQWPVSLACDTFVTR